ncbi:unnamed protein product [Closterium sp. NIES-54]
MGLARTFLPGMRQAPGPLAPATATAAAATAATATANTAATTTAATVAAPAATGAPACCATMASLRVLAFDHLDRFSLTRRLLLPYLFPELSPFATVDDLVSHLRTSDARYRATVLAEFLDRNQPLIFITLYFIVTRLPDSLRCVRDHFLSLDPTSLPVDLLEQHLLAAETSAVAVGAARGTPRPPFFEGCSPSPLAPAYASAAAADVSVAEDVGAASASTKRRSSKGKGGRSSGGGSGGGGGGSGSGGGGSSGGGGGGGTGGGSGSSGGGGGGSGGSGGSGGGGTGGGRTGPRHGGLGGGQRQQQQRRRKTKSPQQLHEWLFQRGMSGGCDSCPSGIAIFDLDFDAILSAMYALSVTVEGDYYRCVPPDPGIAAAALGASESGTLPGTVPTEALHTFTLDSRASAYFFRDSTTLTPLPAPIPVRLADPSGGPVVACSSTVLPCPVRVSICTCTRTGRHLATFTRRPGSSLYTLATEPPQVAASAQVSVSGQVAASCSCRLLSHQTLLWHHRLGHPSMPRRRGMHSHLLVSGLPKSLPLLPPSPTPPCLPCVEGRQRATPHSSSFPPTTAPLQTLHMDVKGEVTRTSMIHAAAPHFLWPFAVRYAAHQLNLWPGVSLPETLPTLRWTGEVGDASVFRIVTFDESVPFYRLFPYCSAPPLPPPLFLAPNPPPVAVGSGAARGAASECAASGGAASEGVDPWGAGSEVAGSGGAEPKGEEPGVAEPEGVEPGGAELEGAESGGAEPRDAALSGGAGDAGVGGAGVTVGAGGTGGTAAVGPGGARTRGAGAGDPMEPRAVGAGGSCTGGAGAGGAGVRGTGAGGAGAAGAGAVDPGVGGAGGTVRPRPYFVPLLEQVLGVPSSTSLTPPLLCPQPDQSQLPLLSASPLPAPSPYTEQYGGLTERCELASHPISPIRTARRAPRSRPPPVPGTHTMALRPSSVPLRVPLPAPPESSLPEVLDPESYRARAASPTVPRLLAAAVTDPSFESASASVLVTELLDFAAACRLDYATALVAESASASPPSVGGECALRTDVLEDRQEDFECLAAAVPHFTSMLLAPEGDPDTPDIPTPRSYAEAITAFLQGSLHEEIWLRRPLGFSGSFPAGTQWSLRRPVYGLRRATREWHDTLRTKLAALGFAPSTADPSLFLRTDTSLPPFYVLVYVDDFVFATSYTEALTLVKLKLQKRHTCTDSDELRSYLGLQITRDGAQRTITLTPSHTVHLVLQHFGFQFSSPQPTPLSTGHSLSAPPSDESVEPSGPYLELVGCLMYLMTCTRPDLAYPLSLLARYVAPGRH